MLFCEWFLYCRLLKQRGLKSDITAGLQVQLVTPKPVLHLRLKPHRIHPTVLSVIASVSCTDAPCCTYHHNENTNHWLIGNPVIVAHDQSRSCSLWELVELKQWQIGLVVVESDKEIGTVVAAILFPPPESWPNTLLE